MSALKGDVPVLEPRHKYHLDHSVRKLRGKGHVTKFRWRCDCTAVGEWVHTAALASGGWTKHIEESARTSRAALYGEDES